jgi:hypothetical protein
MWLSLRVPEPTSDMSMNSGWCHWSTPFHKWFCNRPQGLRCNLTVPYFCKIWGFHGGDWRMPSFAMWRRVLLVWTNVSEERIASIFRVDKSTSEEPAWARSCRLSYQSKTTSYIRTGRGEESGPHGKSVVRRGKEKGLRDGRAGSRPEPG